MQDPDPAKSAAMQALQAAVIHVRSDSSRPVYHFCPPAQWMNDINAPLFYKGYYHIFYQHNPFGDMPMGERLAHMHWGHARSRDLVSWEHLPIALAPSFERGEKSCWSGCAAIDSTGRPRLIYTAVFEDEMPFKRPFEQWAAVGDDDLVSWHKDADNPLLSLPSHGGPGFSPEWRDPFVFTTAGRAFMILGACGDAGIPIYEAQNPALTAWKRAGRLLAESVECPNFLPLDDKWVFICSPFDLVRYSVGTFDPGSLRFSPETPGTIDWGHYYGTNVLIDAAGRRILFGWIPGWNWDVFQMGRGWNGCMALPRVLTLDAGGRLLQKPVPELEKLRTEGKSIHRADASIRESTPITIRVDGDAFELAVAYADSVAEGFGVRLQSDLGAGYAATIRFNRPKEELEVADRRIPLKSHISNQSHLRIFVDRSVMEVYVNDGEAVVAQMTLSSIRNPRVTFFSEGGTTRLASLDIWMLRSAQA